MVRQRYIAPDGTPDYVIHAEQWLVGGAMLAPAIPSLQPEDFHDESLGTVWRAVSQIASTGREATVPAVAQLLAEWGALDAIGTETRLTTLAADPLAFLYAGTAALKAQAELVSEWGARRRRIAELAEEVRAVSGGKVVESSHRFRGGVVIDA